MIRPALVAATLLVVAACNGGSGGTTATPAPTTQPPTTTSSPQATTAPADTAATSATATTTTVPDFDLIEVDLTAPGDDPGRVPVELGHTVRLVITADTTDEVHLHGYDIKASVAPGSPAVLDFVADIPGISTWSWKVPGKRSFSCKWPLDPSSTHRGSWDRRTSRSPRTY